MGVEDCKSEVSILHSVIMRKPKQNRTTHFVALFPAIVLLAMSALAAAGDNGLRIPVVSVRKDAEGITLKMNPGAKPLKTASMRKSRPTLPRSGRSW